MGQHIWQLVDGRNAHAMSQAHKHQLQLTMNSSVDRLFSTKPVRVATAKRSGGGGSNMPAGALAIHSTVVATATL